MGNKCCNKNGEYEQKLELGIDPNDQSIISETNFRINAQTGDLILFRTKTFAAGMQRQITQSEYDHVGIIIRGSADASEVFYLEAVSCGVRLNKWSFLRNCVVNTNNNKNEPEMPHVIYEKVAFRHVKIQRSRQFLRRMQDFIKDTIDKKYSVSFSKLTQRKTQPVMRTDQSSEFDIFSSISDFKAFRDIEEHPLPEKVKIVNTDRTFFCSELVAKAFKTLGVIKDDDTSCTMFYPAHFSSSGESFLKLMPGISIEPEKVIQLDRVYVEELAIYAQIEYFKKFNQGLRENVDV